MAESTDGEDGSQPLPPLIPLPETTSIETSKELTFTLFPKLPIELRLKIWKEAIPKARVVKVEIIMPEPDNDVQRPSIRSPLQASSLLRACKASRDVILSVYKVSINIKGTARTIRMDGANDTLCLWERPCINHRAAKIPRPVGDQVQQYVQRFIQERKRQNKCYDMVNPHTGGTFAAVQHLATTINFTPYAFVESRDLLSKFPQLDTYTILYEQADKLQIESSGGCGIQVISSATPEFRARLFSDDPPEEEEALPLRSAGMEKDLDSSLPSISHLNYVIWEIWMANEYSENSLLDWELPEVRSGVLI